MPAVEIADIRAAIVANIEAANLPALSSGKTWNVQPYFLSTLTTPLIALKADPIEYDLAMSGGLDKVMFCCYVLIGSGGVDIAMQQTIDRLMDPRSASSLKKAVETPDFQGRATLGGIVSQVVVRSCNGQKEYEARGGNIVLGTDFNIEVWT
jgi:hypothetical protein